MMLIMSGGRLIDLLCDHIICLLDEFSLLGYLIKYRFFAPDKNACDVLVDFEDLSLGIFSSNCTLHTSHKRIIFAWNLWLL